MLIFLTNMEAIKIEVEVDNSLSSVASTGAIHLSHTGHDSEEDVPAPFIFVDVNVSQEEPNFGDADMDLEVDVNSHQASPFVDIYQAEEKELAYKAVSNIADEELKDKQRHEVGLECGDTLRELPAFNCKVCNQGFMHRTDLRLHSRTHTGWVNFTKAHLSHKSHLIDHSYCITGSNTQFCHLCNREFTKLQEHYRTHTGEKPYKCGQCGRQFSLRGSLKRHSSVHTREKHYQCNICYKWLSTKHSLRNHKLLHENRLFECHVCHVKFSRSKNFIIHSRLHCTEKHCNTRSLSPHNKLQYLGKKCIRCEICYKKFSNKGNLFQHYRIHKVEGRNQQEGKPFKCEVCCKQFSTASTLRRHSHMHS